MNKTNQYHTVDLFCGIGGLTHGFVKEGLNVVAGLDIDSSCKFGFEYNNNSTFIQSDVSIVHSSSIAELYPKTSKKILVGCAPCQPFSSYNKNKSKDEKWKLLYSFSRIIKEILPDIISMENVPMLLKHNNGSILNDFVKILEDLKYNVWYKVVNAQDYGVPQRRKRLVLLASRLGEIKMIPPTHQKGEFVTVRQAISQLPKINDGTRHPKDKLHRSRKLSPLNKKRIQSTPEGGSWKDWSEDLLLECHKKESGKSFGSVYGRMRWDDVSPTLTTQCTGLGNGRFGHPEQDRAISLREAAILQSFPKNYKFCKDEEDISTKKIERYIGNSVPVKLGQAIAKSIINHINHYG